MLLLSSESRRLDRGVLGGRRPVRTLMKFSTVTWTENKHDLPYEFKTYMIWGLSTYANLTFQKKSLSLKIFCIPDFELFGDEVIAIDENGDEVQDIKECNNHGKD